MKYLKNIARLLFLLGIAGSGACEKYKDPAPEDIDLEGRVYCNDPVAANYNQGFPGKVDNSTCVYATDLFEGVWTYEDSVFLPDLTFVSTATYTLNFSAKDRATDTLRNSLIVSGFCPGRSLELTANRFGSALTDTLIQYTEGGQYFCRDTDTVSGMFRIMTDSTSTRMNIQLSTMTPEGGYIHNGHAIKQ